MFKMFYGQTNVKKRSDGLYDVYVVLNWSDLGIVSADDAYHAVISGQTWRNPLTWVKVAVAKPYRSRKPSKHGEKTIAIAEADRWKESLKNGTRPAVASALITELSSIASMTDGASGLIRALNIDTEVG